MADVMRKIREKAGRADASAPAAAPAEVSPPGAPTDPQPESPASAVEPTEVAAEAQVEAPSAEPSPGSPSGFVPTESPASAVEPTEVTAEAQVEAPSAEPSPSPPSAFVPSEPSTPVRTPAKPSVEPISPSVISTDTVAWDAQKVDPAVVAFHDRCSGICEQYRAIRARLLSMNPSGARQVIAITSSIPQEGKSVSTVNLGLVMAEGGEHGVVIADADFRRTSLARMLGISDGPGLAELIRGEAELAEVLRPTPYPNLKVIPAGTSADKNYADLLGSQQARATLAQLRGVFDYTFLDTPPVTTVADVSTLAPYCDGAIVVIEMRRTPEPTVQQAVRTLQTNNVRVLGCILSRDQDRPSRYYDRYYYRYYRND